MPPEPEKEKTAEAEKDLPADLHPPNSSPEDMSMEENADAPVTTRAQGRKRKAGNLTENRPSRQSPRLNPATNQDGVLSPQPPPKAAPGADKAATSKKNAGTTGVQKAVQKAQEQARKKAEVRDSMWGRIAKAVDDAMEAEAPEQIERQYINYIVNAILECALPKLPLAKKPSQNQPGREKEKEQEEGQDMHGTGETAESSTSPITWASVAAKRTKPEVGKPTLAALLRGSRPDERLMVRLGKDSPHRAEHPFVLQKKANTALPSKIVVR